jgi:hypothetical protein
VENDPVSESAVAVFKPVVKHASEASDPKVDRLKKMTVSVGTEVITKGYVSQKEGSDFASDTSDTP